MCCYVCVHLKEIANCFVICMVFFQADDLFEGNSLSESEGPDDNGNENGKHESNDSDDDDEDDNENEQDDGISDNDSDDLNVSYFAKLV